MYSYGILEISEEACVIFWSSQKITSSEVHTKMTAVGESESSLATKCLDFCQTLASQGKAFNFSLSIGSAFSFSLDTRDKVPALDTKSKATPKKMPSPSTIRRNARRRDESLNKKLKPAAEPSASARPLNIHPSPTALSERRQVVSLGRSDPVIPSFSQLDGTTSPPSPSGSPACAPQPPFEQPCTGKPDDDENYCRSSTDPEYKACFETQCDTCTRHLCSYEYQVEKCSDNCGFHHCHKKIPGSDVVWGFRDKDCKRSHMNHCACQCHCADIECRQNPYIASSHWA